MISDNCCLDFFPFFWVSILALCSGLSASAGHRPAPRALPVEPSLPWHPGQLMGKELARSCARGHHEKDVGFGSGLCFGRGVGALRCLPQWVADVLSGL